MSIKEEFETKDMEVDDTDTFSRTFDFTKSTLDTFNQLDGIDRINTMDNIHKGSSWMYTADNDMKFTYFLFNDLPVSVQKILQSYAVRNAVTGKFLPSNPVNDYIIVYFDENYEAVCYDVFTLAARFSAAIQFNDMKFGKTLSSSAIALVGLTLRAAETRYTDETWKALIQSLLSSTNMSEKYVPIVKYTFLNPILAFRQMMCKKPGWYDDENRTASDICQVGNLKEYLNQVEYKSNIEISSSQFLLQLDKSLYQDDCVYLQKTMEKDIKRIVNTHQYLKPEGAKILKLCSAIFDLTKLRTLVDEQCLPNKYIRGPRTGVGSNATVYTVCLKDNKTFCPYVVKVTGIEYSKGGNELLVSYVAGEMGISPKIHDFWLCARDNTLRILMDKIDGVTLRIYYKENHNDKAKILALSKQYEYINKYMQYVGIGHGDPHNDNWMVTVNGEAPTLKVIDWGAGGFTLPNYDAFNNPEEFEDFESWLSASLEAEGEDDIQET